MTTLQISVEDTVKRDADGLFSRLGIDTATAIRIFLNAAIKQGGIPFQTAEFVLDDDLRKAVEDTRLRRNLYGPFDSAEEAVAAMLED